MLYDKTSEFNSWHNIYKTFNKHKSRYIVENWELKYLCSENDVKNSNGKVVKN